MTRDNRIKYYCFAGSPDLNTDSVTHLVESYTDTPINGRIQCIYYQAGDYAATGSLWVLVSGTETGLTATEGKILFMTSGTSTGHHLGEDWLVFPRVATVTTGAIPISGAGGWSEFKEISVHSHIKVAVSGAGKTKSASGLTIVYI